MKKLALLSAAALLFAGQTVGIAQEGCTDERCYRQQQYYMHPAHQCCPPQQQIPDNEPDRPTGGYVAPPATGETVGGSNAIGLRLGALRIPEINIPLPTLKLPSIVHYKRAPEVYLDRAIAAYQPNAQIMDFGQIPSTDSQPDRPSQQPDRPTQSPQCCPPQCIPQTQPESGCVPPGSYCPPQRQPEGCADRMQLEAGPWRSTPSYELAKKEQQVERLHAQVDQLRELVKQLAEKQNQQAANNQKSTPVTPAGFQRPSQQLESIPSNKLAPESSPTITQQMASLQSQLDALKAAQGNNGASTPKREVLLNSEKLETQDIPATNNVPNKSVFGRFGRFFRRG